MCGRYAMRATTKELQREFPFIEDEYFDIHGYQTRNEVFPGTEILAIDSDHKPKEYWWTIEDRDAKGVWRRAINAKAENLQWAGMFKDAYKNGRVLIPATGIYEWQVQPDGSKKKFEIWFDEPVFTFGGIARECLIKEAPRDCCAIITTKANSVFAEIHNSKQRQAVVIRNADRDRWLDPETPLAELQRMLQPLPDDETHFKAA